MPPSAKPRSVHRCRECGAESPRWLGRCAVCDAWGTLVEVVAPRPVSPRVGPASGDHAPACPVLEVDATLAVARATGVGEVDRVLGGGLVPGSVTLLAGEPGTGKSTLLLQVLGRMADGGARCLLVSAEESCAQVRDRAERVGAVGAGLLVASATTLSEVFEHVDATTPDVLVVDSIQTVFDPELPGAPGSITQVRDCCYRLVRLAKARAMVTLLVGHVTKEGTLAGPRVLEHVVDTVLSFDGDRGHPLRSLHALKHRFGGTGELGLFEMTVRGLVDVPDASVRFLVDRRPGVPGSAVAAVAEGGRPVLVEVQALVVPSRAPAPRRAATGLDAARLGLVLAVLAQRGALRVAEAEVYASVAGGLRVTEPGCDLALALALASAHLGRPVTDGTVASGEVGLGGEIRSVPQVERRVAEAARLGFTRVLVPATAPEARAGITVVPVGDVCEAIAAA